MCFNGTNNLQEITLSGLNTEIELEVDLLPEPALLDDITITCNPDTFLEVLMGNVKRQKRSRRLEGRERARPRFQ
jgi:hypothetical protein